MDLWNLAKDTVGAAANSGVVRDLSAAAQNAAADQLALRIDDVFGVDKDFLAQSQVVVPAANPELSKVKAPSEEAENAEPKMPKWAIPAAAVVFMVLTIVMFVFGRKKGGKK